LEFKSGEILYICQGAPPHLKGRDGIDLLMKHAGMKREDAHEEILKAVRMCCNSEEQVKRGLRVQDIVYNHGRTSFDRMDDACNIYKQIIAELRK
jgi:hypothetical protein